jgi:hypothetical protein
MMSQAIEAASTKLRGEFATDHSPQPAVGRVRLDVRHRGIELHAWLTAGCDKCKRLLAAVIPPLSEEFPLARTYAGQRAMRIFDGPDEVHRQTVAQLELAAQRTTRQVRTGTPVDTHATNTRAHT